MDGFQTACSLLPDSLTSSLSVMNNAEELRFRIGQRPTALICGIEYPFSDTPADAQLLLRILDRATDASIHSCSSTLRNGFVSYMGLRIGICGQAILSEGQIIGFGAYSSLSIRIPHEHQGICSVLINSILSRRPDSCLIIGPPGAGKTTVLRELIRCSSDMGYRTAAADERNELAAMYRGEAQYDLGMCTDVITGMPKSDAAMMLLRTMNPQIIAMDEISQGSDIEAIYNIAGCGVSVFASAHGRDADDMRTREIYRVLLDSGVFKELLTIGYENGARKYSLERI